MDIAEPRRGLSTISEKDHKHANRLNSRLVRPLLRWRPKAANIRLGGYNIRHGSKHSNIASDEVDAITTPKTGKAKSEQHTLSSSTTQVSNSSSYDSKQPRSFATWLIDKCRKPVSCANCSQWTVFPTPGVPVIITFGDVRILILAQIYLGW